MNRLGWVIRLLGLHRRADGAGELTVVRTELFAALLSLHTAGREEAAALQAAYRLERDGLKDEPGKSRLEDYRQNRAGRHRGSRSALEDIRGNQPLNADEYNFLLEDLDFRELTVPLEEAQD